MLNRILQGLAWLVVGGLLLQVYLAGAALFGAASFQPHRALGDGLAGAIVALLIVALVARSGRRVVGLAAVLTALVIVQLALPSARSALPLLAALHAVNAVALVAVAVAIASASHQAAVGRNARQARLASAETP